MQIQISSRDLLRGINAVAKVINSRNALPIMSNVLFSQDGQRFMVTGSDGENELTADVDISILEGVFKPFCIDPVKIQNAIGTLGDQPLTIIVDHQDMGVNITVRYLNGEFSMSGLLADEYPRLKTPDEILCHFSISTRAILSNVASAQVCCNNDDLRPQMACVCLDVTSSDKVSPMPEHIVFVGTDGHKLYKNIVSQGDDLSFAKIDGKAMLLIPRTLVPTLVNAFRQAETIEVKAVGKKEHVDDSGNKVPDTIHNLIFTAPGVEFIIRSVEGRYPNYNSVIPTEHKYSVTFGVKDLKTSIKRVAQFANSDSLLISLDVENGNIFLKSQDIDFNTSSKESLVATESNFDADFHIGMKSSTLLDQLANVGTENVRVLLTDPARPIILNEDDDNSQLTMLVMPMLLN